MIKQLNFRQVRNDMHFEVCILDGEEFWHINLSGYDDKNWWDKVGNKKHRMTITNREGTKNVFIVDYANRTIEYTPIMEVLREYQNGARRCYKKELDKYKELYGELKTV